MPTQDQQQRISNAIARITDVQGTIKQEIANTGDTSVKITLTNESIKVDLYLSTLLQAQNAADDNDFSSATQALQEQEADLKKAADNIKAVVADVATAAKIVNDITLALAFIAKL